MLEVKEVKTIEPLIKEIRYTIKDDINRDRNVILISYILYKAVDKGLENLEEVLRYEDSKIKKLVEKIALDQDAWIKLFKLTKIYAKDDFKNLALSYQTDFCLGTPPSVAKLALKLLKVEANQKIVELGCGYADFLSIATTELPFTNLLQGYEIDEEIATIASARGSLAGFDIGNTDIYNLVEAGMRKSFHRGFSVLNWGSKATKLQGAGAKFVESLGDVDINPFINNNTSAEWAQAHLMKQLLNENGRAAVIMTMGALTNNQDAQARRHFVDNQYIEMVIELPEKMFAPYTAISTALVILSSDNKKMRMVDASDIYTKGRRCNEFTDDDLEKIITRCVNNGEQSTLVNTFMRGSYPLNPKRYLIKQDTLVEGISFGDIILDVQRGAQLNARKLDEINSVEPTNTKYIKVNNIQAGEITGEINYLKRDAGLDRYYITNKSLIVSKVVGSGKVAFAEVPEGENWVLGANLFSLTIDESKADPLYIKLFLESDKGINLMRAIGSGLTVPMITIDALKELKLPLPNLEEQKRVVGKYVKLYEKVKQLRLEYEAAYSKMKNILKE